MRANLSTAPSSAPTIAAVILATVATVFPGFLIGALSVQVSDEFALSEATYGWGLGGFFLAATLGSILFGRLAQRIGPRRQMLTVLAVSAVLQMLIATVANSFLVIVILLGGAGLMNAANQTAVNLALAQAELPRLGLAIALKQSAMPAAAVLSGFAVPAIALTVGWRWAYGLGVVLAVLATAAIHQVLTPAPVTSARPKANPITPRRVLIRSGLAFMFLAFGAGALTAWLVGSAVNAGMDEGSAGWLLSAGASLGIALRIVVGFRLDTMARSPFRVASIVVVFGAVGMALLGVRSSVVALAATALAFGGGWTWPVFTNFGIVRANAEAAGAATGVTQTGVYVGVFAAPLVSGWIIETWGYPTMWLVVATSMLIGAAISFVVGEHFLPPSNDDARPQ